MKVEETKTEQKAVQILNLWLLFKKQNCRRYKPPYAKSALIQIYDTACQNWENLPKSCLNLKNVLLFINKKTELPFLYPNLIQHTEFLWDVTIIIKHNIQPLKLIFRNATE